MSYTRAQLIKLAQDNEDELVRILSNSQMNVKTLSLGIEIFGEEASTEEIILPIFNRLLKHVHAGVRESAMAGMASFYMINKPPTDLIDKIKYIAISDPSPTVKELAKTIIKDWEY